MKDFEATEVNRPKETGCLMDKLFTSVEANRVVEERPIEPEESEEDIGAPKIAPKIFRMSFDWSRVKI